MEVSCTSSPSHDAPTEGDSLSGDAVANLYITLRCAGVFQNQISVPSLVSSAIARKEGKEMVCVIRWCEEKAIIILIIPVIYYIGQE